MKPEFSLILLMLFVYKYSKIEYKAALWRYGYEL